MIIDVCPICGGFDIGDWCKHCDVPTKQVDTNRNTKDEQEQHDRYCAEQLKQYIKDNEPKPTR